MSRGIAKRTIFECRDDFRYFLSLLAREARHGLIEVHAFVLVQNHLHLLLCSPVGQLSRVMERVLRGYSRWFNRRRGRDGPLFKGRFKSKRVDSDAYRSLLVRYIDDNAVKPGLAPHAAAYPYGSAFRYSQRDGPCWLERTWIEQEVKAVRGSLHYEPPDYSVRFPSRLPEALREWIEDRLVRRRPREEEFPELLAPHAHSQIDWMVRKALLADGTEPFRIPLPPALVEAEWARLRDEEPGWPWDAGREPGALWPAMLAGLLRHSCALSYPEIRARSGVPDSTTAGRADRHRDRLQHVPEYARRTAVVIERVERRLVRESYPHRFVAVDAVVSAERTRHQSPGHR
jgi:REP element-mobilizing transposase RayT